MAVLVTNNAWSTLAGAITNAATSLTVANAASFPVISGSDVFYATLANSSNTLEIVKVTATSGTTFTIVRAQDGTTASAYSLGDRIELRPTAALFNSKLDTGVAATTYAPIASPTFTGTPIGTTPASATDNTTKIATTQWVNNYAATLNILTTTAAAATYLTQANAATTYATLAGNPNFTGAPTIGAVAIATQSYVTSQGYITGTGTTTGNAGGLSGSSWTVTLSGTKITFAFGGVNKFSVDTSGNVIAAANITAYGTP